MRSGRTLYRHTTLKFANDLDPGVRGLIALRLARSIGQGALVVDLALYLKALGWSATVIGSVLGGTGLLAAGFSLAVGVSSDRLRRRPFLIAAEVLTIACALLALASAHPLVLAPAILLGGFGRGAGGAATFFAPAEQAWLAALVPPRARGRVYSLNVAAGLFGMAAGAVLAVLPELLAPLLGAIASYRVLFLIPLAASCVNLVVLSRLPERRPPPAPEREAAARRVVHRRENWLLARLVGLNSVNGIAIGLIGPLITYWFAVRFHVGPAAIGPLMAVTFAVTAVAALGTGRLTDRFGVVPAVVWLRSLAVVLLALLPFMPVYPAAALLYAARSALNRGSVGARQALVVSLVRDERRGFAASLNAASFQFAQSAGPAAAGALLDSGLLMAPFLIAAGLQAAYALGYYLAFRRHDPARAIEAESS